MTGANEMTAWRPAELERIGARRRVRVLSRVGGGRGVAVQDLFAVGAAGLGGPSGCRMTCQPQRWMTIL